MTTPTLRQRLQGLEATLVILMLVAGVPLLLIAIGAAPSGLGFGRLPALLSSPDDGTLAMVFIATIAWVAWLFVALSVIVEVVARLRGLSAPSLPGLGVPQRTVGRLVAEAALLFVAAPTVIAAFPAPPTHAAAAAPVPVERPHVTLVESSPVPPESEPVVAAANYSAKEMSTTEYTVKRGDSLWKIADRLLGDGTRFPEIVELNDAVLNGQPDFIVSGTVLRVPAVTETDDDRPAEQYVVKPEDTLSEIAEAELGDSIRYPDLFEASRDTIQPDGATLTDPDLIRPGWQITIPGQAKHKTEEPREPVEPTPPVPAEPAVEPPTAEPSPSATANPQPTRIATTSDGTNDEGEASSPGWLLPGLTGAGAVLAALILVAVRAHRNTQLRYRSPGQTIAPPPQELRAVEKTAFVSGGPLMATIEQLDRTLRHLASVCDIEGRAVPPIVRLTLRKGTATVHLASDTDLPEPWTGAEREWSAPLGEPLPDRDDMIAPYPLLVTIGRDNTDALHLINLEHLRVASLTGDPASTTALARHIAAELALNPWSVLVDVTVIGLGNELAALDSLRLHHHIDGGAVITSIAHSLRSARNADWSDPETFRAVVTAGAGAGELAGLLSSPVPRLGAAVVSLDTPVPEATVIQVDNGGKLRVPSLGLDLSAAGLTSGEAAACAAIVDLTRESQPVRVPPFAQAADGWRALADQMGALREELTDVRTEGRAGEGSLLPNSSEEYAEAAATTPEDVETLAPVVAEDIRGTVEGADPTLDEDVAAWFNAESKRPRLTLLGPVKARAFGVLAPAIAKRKPYFIEILAFLALHPEGVTASAVADAFGVAASRARTDIGALRDWLGENPRTGALHLPAANESPTFRETGVKTYQVQDVLADLDLFRRLRARGEARGSQGIADLKTAMSLVEGQPFSLLRERGWSWLLDTERVHETISCAIVDTAHVLVIDALAKGDLGFARETAQMACKAAPYDDICRLDLVKVTAAEGHLEAADQMLTDHVLNRTDDYLPPIDLPRRTGEVVDKQRWGKRAGTPQ